MMLKYYIGTLRKRDLMARLLLEPVDVHRIGP